MGHKHIWRNSALDFIRSDDFKRSRFKIFAWPMLLFGLLFFWDTCETEEAAHDTKESKDE